MTYQTFYLKRFQTFQIGQRGPIQCKNQSMAWVLEEDLKTVIAASDLQHPQAVDQDDSCSLFNAVELPKARSTWVRAPINVPCWPPDPRPIEVRRISKKRRGQLRLNVRSFLRHCGIPSCRRR